MFIKCLFGVTTSGRVIAQPAGKFSLKGIRIHPNGDEIYQAATGSLLTRSIEMLIQKKATSTLIDALWRKSCRHLWDIDQSAGPNSIGVCVNCRQKRVFANPTGEELGSASPPGSIFARLSASWITQRELNSQSPELRAAASYDTRPAKFTTVR